MQCGKCNVARISIFQHLLISCKAREFDVAKDWAALVTDEFANQGKMEVDANIETCLFGGPPPPGDIKDMAERQLGFMNIFAGALFERMTDILPEMSFTVENVDKNKKIWKDVLEEENSRTPLGNPSDRRKSSIHSAAMLDENEIDVPPEASPEEPRMGEPQVVRPAMPVDPNANSRRSSVQSGNLANNERRGSHQSSYIYSKRTPSPRRGSIATSSHYDRLTQSSRDARRSSLGTG